jgi:DNA-binding ferritin-like protein
MTRTPENLPPRVQNKAIAALNQTAAELFDLFSDVKRAYWNTPGLNFIRLDDLAGQIMGHLDRVAERTAELGGLTQYGIGERAGLSPFKFKRPVAALSGSAVWLQELADLHVLVSGHVRQAVDQLIQIHDFSSADVLADILRTLNLHLALLEGQLSQQSLRN